MHSTWLDNDQTCDNSKRIESASKKGPTNRIQRIENQSDARPKSPPQSAACADQFGVYESDLLRQEEQLTPTQGQYNRGRDGEGLTREKYDEADARAVVIGEGRVRGEDKGAAQIKQYDSELSKLKIKIQNNNEMIATKDQIIEQLRDQLRRASPNKQHEQSKTTQVSPSIVQKINDVEVKFVLLMESQNKLGVKMADISSRVELIQKGLLSILACKMANIQKKTNEFVEMATAKLNNVEVSALNKFKKQTSAQKSGPVLGLEAVMQRLDGLRQQVYIFKNKDFRYQNSNIVALRKDLTNAQNTMIELERKLSLAQNMLRSSKCSSRKNQGFGSANNSCYFDDYEQVYEDADSVGDDQFFHPLEQSNRKFHSNTKQYHTSNQRSQNTNANKFDRKQVVHQFRSGSKPGTNHNDSFENFTSDEEEEETPNQRRLRTTLQAGGHKLPLSIEIDLTGYIRKKSDHSYLLDCDKRVFMLSASELEQCRVKGLIAW